MRLKILQDFFGFCSNLLLNLIIQNFLVNFLSKTEKNISFL